MKKEQRNTENSSKTPSQNQKNQSGRGKTDVPGQNPKQNDAPDHDEHHDESRQNPLDK